MEPRSQDLDQVRALIKFTRKMSAMIDVGISLARCLDTLSKDEPSPYGAFCKSLMVRWESGDEVYLSTAMLERPDLFAPFYVKTIKCGEIGGILEESLAQLAELLEVAFRIRSLTGNQAEWAWMLYPSGQPDPKDWNELDDAQETLILMLYTRSFGQMLAAGVPLLQALGVAAEFIPVNQREDFLQGSEKSINKNNRWSTYLAGTSIASEFLMQMVDIGEISGNLDIVFEKVADVYQNQLECELM